jgi:hypothetical protein
MAFQPLNGVLDGVSRQALTGYFSPCLKDPLCPNRYPPKNPPAFRSPHRLQLRNLVTRERPYKVTDGNSLFVLVSPSGSRAWRWKYLFAGKEKVLPLGIYPEVTLAQARAAQDEARKMLRGASTQRKSVEMPSWHSLPPRRTRSRRPPALGTCASITAIRAANSSNPH